MNQLDKSKVYRGRIFKAQIASLIFFIILQYALIIGHGLTVTICFFSCFVLSVYWIIMHIKKTRYDKARLLALEQKELALEKQHL